MLSSMILVLVLCLDAFAVSVAYGVNKIKFTIASTLVISLVGTSFLGISLFAANIIGQFVPGDVCKWAGFIILFMIGFTDFFQGSIKSYLRSKTNYKKDMKFKFCDIKFAVAVYLDETKADADNSKQLSVKEAFYLAVALSIDSLAIGFGSGLAQISIWETLIFCFILNFVAIWFGFFIGQHISKASKIDLYWLSGLILIGIAFGNLI
ncbi:MAG: sporulation protein [Oscillospiraceae bacterium]|nr:sporulation protein [Oscillospiraceae bacterium]